MLSHYQLQSPRLIRFNTLSFTLILSPGEERNGHFFRIQFIRFNVSMKNAKVWRCARRRRRRRRPCHLAAEIGTTPWKLEMKWIRWLLRRFEWCKWFKSYLLRGYIDRWWPFLSIWVVASIAARGGGRHCRGNGGKEIPEPRFLIRPDRTI